MVCSPLRLWELTHSLQSHFKSFPPRFLLVRVIRVLSGMLLTGHSPIPASLPNFAVLKQNNMVPIQIQRNVFHFLDRHWKQPLASPDLNGPDVGDGSSC